MKRGKKNMVFVLDREVVTGKVGMIVNANTDKTKLLHLKLGHIEVKGLKELDKQGVLEGDKMVTWNFFKVVSLGKPVELVSTGQFTNLRRN